MAGNAEYNQITQVSANPSMNVQFLDLSITTAIAAAGGFAFVDVFAQTGYIGEVIALGMIYPGLGAGTTGNRIIDITAANQDVGILQGQSLYSNDLRYTYGCFNAQSDNTTWKPSDVAAQAKMLDKLVYDATNGLRFLFKNSTDAADPGVTKNIYLWVRNIKIA